MKNREACLFKLVRRSAIEDVDHGSSVSLLLLFSVFIIGLGGRTLAQEPSAGPPGTVSIPAVQESKLKNGLTVAVIEKRNVPLITVQLLVKVGAENETIQKAGLADMTASMLTKGTKRRTATQISEEIEFLGGTIFSLSDWNSSSIRISVTSDKVDQAMSILADVVLNPTFPQSELDLLKSQAIDGLTYNLTQPGFLTNYVASVYSFEEHPSGGTPASLEALKRNDVLRFYRQNYRPSGSVLLFAGDISSADANALAQRLFGSWKGNRGRRSARPNVVATVTEAPSNDAPLPPIAKRVLVIDLPDSGQASVSLAIKGYEGRAGNTRRVGGGDGPYYPASVLNSLLGGGYSSRLNQEIRIKRGLSYGAGSSFGWRHNDFNFSTRTQTKNESAAEVAELVLAEVKRLFEGGITQAELGPRKAVLTGGFSRNIETTSGLANALADLYRFEIPATELNNYMPKVNSVTEAQIREVAKQYMTGGDIVIVGDYAKFRDDLAKRLPEMKLTVIPASDLDISRPGLRK